MKKISLILSIGLLIAIIVASCGGNKSNCASSLKEVTIGNQIWMTENLNVDKFCNGDAIPHAKTNHEWIKAGANKQPAWCYYHYDPANGEKYGKLYNWYAVNDSRGLAPKGWHIPKDEEWTVLTEYLGGEDVAGAKMKCNNGWDENNSCFLNINCENSSGFSGLPGGLRYERGKFCPIKRYGGWWSSSENFTLHTAWFRAINRDFSHLYVGDCDKKAGLSVRCLMD
jgi:uncharacterized protein (TIGR02145 family)